MHGNSTLVEKVCAKCGLTAPMSARRDARNCESCRAEIKREKHRIYNITYYYERVRDKPKPGPYVPPIPEKVIAWDTVPDVIKAGGCCRCGKKAVKASLCQRHLGEYTRQKRKKKVELCA